jgi:hypothetical protein
MSNAVRNDVMRVAQVQQPRCHIVRLDRAGQAIGVPGAEHVGGAARSDLALTGTYRQLYTSIPR